MRVSARCDYACKAVLELALYWPKPEPLHIQIISKKQKIPRRYLVQILIQLKRMGLVESVRGKQGGYNLARPPAKITLGELMREIGGPLLPVANMTAKNHAVFVKIWKEVESAMARILDKITFEDITNKARGMKRALAYQI